MTRRYAAVEFDEVRLPAVNTDPTPKAGHVRRESAVMTLHHDIHIHLPESRDPAVFEAIFEAMKRHLGV